MSLRKITEADLQGYGVVGMEDSPNLSARAMQEKVEEVVRKVVIPAINENVEKTVSKQDLADAVFNAGAGDMLAANYDSNLDGIVNLADNGFFTYTHSKVGNIHYLYGNGSNVKFVSTAAFEDGDVFMIGESYYPAFLIDGDSLPGGFFKEDMVVSCFVHGNCLNFKRGGAGLNFKIVGGTTQPASPKENTIWINTDVAIGEYQFSATEPTARADGSSLQAGDVWVKTSNTSAIKINVLKKNTLTTYPSNCFQWNGNTYVQKDFKVFQNNDWIDGYLYILNNGQLTNGAQTLKTTDGGSVTVTQNTNSISVSVSCNTGWKWPNGRIVSPKIDLSNYSTLVIECNIVSKTGSSGVEINITSNSDGTNGKVVNWETTGTHTITVDVSGYNAEYYIACMVVAGVNADSGSASISAEIADIYLS